MTGFQSKRKMAMSKMAEMDYDIQELFIEGLTAFEIAQQLMLPVDQVKATLSSFGVDAEDMSPFNTVNS